MTEGDVALGVTELEGLGAILGVPSPLARDCEGGRQDVSQELPKLTYRFSKPFSRRFWRMALTSNFLMSCKLDGGGQHQLRCW